ncbi:MAG: hypothetical protein IK088_02125 [Lachnospiraceae bacterium]|nr:hypothetical protein [Lachnospiraceae bacterium]
MIKTVKIRSGNLPEAWASILEEVALRRMNERGSVTKDESAGFTVALRTADLPEDAYTLTPGKDGVMIEASTLIGFFSGLGRFLRNSDFRPGEGFDPGTLSGTFTPDKPFRAIYYATHNYNFYHAAPAEEVARYLEDSALWGQNALVVWYDMNHFTAVDTPESQAFIAFIKRLFASAKRVGMKIAFTSNANEAFFNSEPELRADWMPQNGYFRKLNAHYHKEYCPSKPGGMEAILRDREAVLKAFSDVDLDYFITWPYDQGGCTCEKCRIWGANGYLKIARAIRPLLNKYFPKAKMCLSAWYFDLFIRGEWDAFHEEIKNGDYREWISYVVVDFKHNEPIPKFLKEEKSVAGIPMLDFTEISMFSASPWGGFGCNADPGRFSGIWERLSPLMAGGLPYSEGIHEDVNKIIMLGFFYGISDNVEDILREYCRFEFGTAVADKIVEVLDLFGGTVTRQFVQEDYHPEGTSPYRYLIRSASNVDYIKGRVDEAEAMLDEETKRSWRWKLISLRASIDAELKKDKGFVSEKTNGMFRELMEIYHTDERTAYCCAPPVPETVFHALGTPYGR